MYTNSKSPHCTPSLILLVSNISQFFKKRIVLRCAKFSHLKICNHKASFTNLCFQCIRNTTPIDLFLTTVKQSSFGYQYFTEIRHAFIYKCKTPSPVSKIKPNNYAKSSYQPTCKLRNHRYEKEKLRWCAHHKTKFKARFYIQDTVHSLNLGIFPSTCEAV